MTIGNDSECSKGTGVIFESGQTSGLVPFASPFSPPMWLGNCRMVGSWRYTDFSSLCLLPHVFECAGSIGLGIHNQQSVLGYTKGRGPYLRVEKLAISSLLLPLEFAPRP